MFDQAIIQDNVFLHCIKISKNSDGKIDAKLVAEHFVHELPPELDKGEYLMAYQNVVDLLSKRGLLKFHGGIKYTQNFRLAIKDIHFTVTNFGKNFARLMPRPLRVLYFQVFFFKNSIKGFLTAFGFVTLVMNAMKGVVTVEGWFTYALAAAAVLLSGLLGKNN